MKIWERFRLGFASFAALWVAACSTVDRSQTALKDDTGQPPVSGPLQFVEWDVRFTNPACRLYSYDPATPVHAVNGDLLVAKPKDTFCNGRYDRAASASRPEAPQAKLIQWIEATQPGDEIFFAYLSFSNADVGRALCKAVQDRGVRITFVLDSGTDMTAAENLRACLPLDGDESKRPRLIPRGNTADPGEGDVGIGFAHNKIFMVNPGRSPMKLAFSSGNMTSGIVLHHENWNFVTLNSDTYFAQAHLCLMNAQLDAAATASRNSYAAYIAACRSRITSELGFQEESDVKVFFTPGEGIKARNALLAGIKRADRVDLAAHRYKYPFIGKALKCAASRPSQPALVRIVTDDDTYWVGTTGVQTGDNQRDEYDKIQEAVAAGAQVRWLETNHAQHLLHHNKYVVMNKADGSWGAVFGGAGNFTGSAFGTNDGPRASCATDAVNTFSGDGYPTNFENFYYIEIPSVLARYNEQFPLMWDRLATPTERMPTRDVMPLNAVD